MKPYIYPFKSPNNYYFYDVNTDGVVDISDSLYHYLSSNNDIPKDVDSILELDNDDRKMLKSLIEQGYLSEHRVKTIRHYHTSDLEFQIKNRASQLILQVTQSCNLVCSYCPYANKTNGDYQRNHSSKKMDWDIAKKSIDIFLEHSSEIEDLTISFYGGEPFLNFPLIKKAVQYADEAFIGKKVSYSLTTNGTLITDEIIEFLKVHSFKVTFSIDGPPSIHDVNRKKVDGTGSYYETVKNMKKLVAAYGRESDTKISINTVINPETDFDEVLHLFDDPFFVENHIVINPTIASSDKLEKKLMNRADFLEKYNYNRFMALMKYFGITKKLKLDPISNTFVSMQIGNSERISKENGILGDITAPGGPCIPGQRKLFVNADGNLYPCEKANELAEDTMLGSIRDGIHINKAERILNIAQLTERECKNCFAFRHCTSCGVNSIDANNFSVERKLRKCSRIKKNMLNSLRLISLRREIDSEYERKIKI